MAIKSKEELLNSIKTVLADTATTNEGIALMEDFSDTYDDILSKHNNDSEDWKKKYEENDKEWRRKYVERFESSPSNPDNSNYDLLPPDLDSEEDNEPQTYEDLFKK